MATVLCAAAAGAVRRLMGAVEVAMAKATRVASESACVTQQQRVGGRARHAHELAELQVSWRLHADGQPSAHGLGHVG